jgi:two-component system OmpR family response regulator
MRELLARVRALLRRAATPSTAEADILRTGDLEVDLRRRRALRNGQELSLKPKEFELLAFLVQNRERVFTREQLLNHIWGFDFGGDTSRTVDVHVRWLRQKIEAQPAKPTRLMTVRGVGYRFEG